MSEDFITLQCPNCGGNLEIGKNVTEYKCTHCDMEHIVRQSVGGITLEAFARCPICGRNDKAEKVSSIIRTTQSSSLAELLTPPNRPEFSPMPGRRVGSNLSNINPTVLRIIGAFAVLIGFISMILSYDRLGGDYGKTVVSTLFLASIPVGIGLLIRMWRKKRDEMKSKMLEEEEKIAAYNSEIERKLRAWEKAMDRYSNLYYCQRDDVVFIPGETKSTPVNRMKDLLFEQG